MNGLIMGYAYGRHRPVGDFLELIALGYSVIDVNAMLNKKSGMLGLTGSSDMRDVKAAYQKAMRVVSLYYVCLSHQKYISAFGCHGRTGCDRNLRQGRRMTRLPQTLHRTDTSD